MNPEEQNAKPENELDEFGLESAESVDDFIKELEAKERDLHITADMSIEIAESDFDVNNLPDLVAEEVGAPVAEEPIVAKAEPRQRPPGTNKRVFELEQEVEKLHARLTEMRIERNELQESSDRRFKDFQNFKYRVDRERRGSFIDQLANLAMQMLPVLDNLDRALEAVEQSKTKRSNEFQQFYEGIILVNQQVNEILAEMGVSPISTIGETFDPTFHEAVAIETSSELPPNTIAEEMLRGFRIGNKVIRHSMVKVTSSPPSVPEKDRSNGDGLNRDVAEAAADLLHDADSIEAAADNVPKFHDAPSQEAE